MRHLSITVLLLTLLAIFPVSSANSATIPPSLLSTGSPISDTFQQTASLRSADLEVSKPVVHTVSVHSSVVTAGRLGTVHTTATKAVIHLPSVDAGHKSYSEQITLNR